MPIHSKDIAFWNLNFPPFCTIFSNDMAENWLARPLSARRTRIVLNSLRACFLSLVTLVLGGCAFWRRLLTVLLTGLACSVSSGLIADSTLATISGDGILVGVNAKFNLSEVAKPQSRLRTLRINWYPICSCQYKVYWSAKLRTVSLAKVYQIYVVVGLRSY